MSQVPGPAAPLSCLFNALSGNRQRMSGCAGVRPRRAHLPKIWWVVCAEPAALPGHGDAAAYPRVRHALEAGLRCQIPTLIRQFRHDPAWRLLNSHELQACSTAACSAALSLFAGFGARYEAPLTGVTLAVTSHRTARILPQGRGGPADHVVAEAQPRPALWNKVAGSRMTASRPRLALRNKVAGSLMTAKRPRPVLWNKAAGSRMTASRRHGTQNGFLNPAARFDQGTTRGLSSSAAECVR